MIDLENSITPEKTIVIPSSINYPGIRILISDKDISSKGDRVKITVNVTDCYNSGVQIDATSQTNTNGGNNFGWLFYTPPTPTTTSGFLPEIRFYNPLLHNQYMKRNRAVLNAVKRYIG